MDYKAALLALDGREAKVAACCEEMECELALLGATAVEDKLQVGMGSVVVMYGFGSRSWFISSVATWRVLPDRACTSCSGDCMG